MAKDNKQQTGLSPEDVVELVGRKAGQAAMNLVESNASLILDALDKRFKNSDEDEETIPVNIKVKISKNIATGCYRIGEGIEWEKQKSVKAKDELPTITFDPNQPELDFGGEEDDGDPATY